MRFCTLRNLIRASIFALGLSVLPSIMSASAQTNTNTASTTATTPSTRVVERDDDTDFGWLGLLGLAGLAGLLRKPQQVTVDRTADPATRPNVYSDSKRA
ncbi:MAG: WGxxGxxG-CTERM domain-containing protein [Acidobacteriota bacterium]|nr:WGxxGxxG-CTERM domain-containing protein [Acidobacteriota bacterium]